MVSKQLVATLVILSASALFVSPFAFEFVDCPFQREVGRVTVDPAIEWNQVNTTEAISFEELSPKGQRAVQQALQRRDDSIVICGEHNRPPDFAFSDHQESGHGIYVIEYRSQYYVVTSGESGWPTDWVYLIGFWGSTILVIGVGNWWYRR